MKLKITRCVEPDGIWFRVYRDGVRMQVTASEDKARLFLEALKQEPIEPEVIFEEDVPDIEGVI